MSKAMQFLPSNFKKSSYTWVGANLLKLTECGVETCSKVTRQDIIDMQRLEGEFKERVRRNAPKKVPLPLLVCHQLV